MLSSANRACRGRACPRPRILRLIAALVAVAAPMSPGTALAGGISCAGSTGLEPHAPSAFFGYACADVDCSGHKAGFAWAEQRGIRTARACDDATDGVLVEGCRAYAWEVVTVEQAGFEWARDNEIADPCRCRGAGPRFEAGCAAYVSGFAR
jgi:hypothetical protein